MVCVSDTGQAAKRRPIEKKTSRRKQLEICARPPGSSSLQVHALSGSYFSGQARF